MIVTTGTASGKTLAFNLPVLDALARRAEARALYLYPTKALAQDQARSLGELACRGVRAAIYDGDTPAERRWQIRKWANLILTNPDMLHIGVLPHHDRWGDVLTNLRYVVVDEAHVYRGVFGSHVGERAAPAAAARARLRRRAAVPARLGDDREPRRARAWRSLGVEATVIEDDGAPRAERTVALWNPPLLDAELGLRASALGEASRLLAELVERGLRTICFAKSRKAAELIHRFTATGSTPTTARGWRRTAPATRPQQRREIERRLVEGELLGVTATDALELGIDIGLLDCAISVGFPGTVASLRQQWGRAGPPRPRPRDARRERGRARPVLHARARDAARAPRRGGDPRPREPARARRPRRSPPRSRRRSTTPTARLLGDEALERAPHVPELQRHERAAGSGPASDYPAGTRRRSARRRPTRSRSSTPRAGAVLGLAERERAYSTVHEGAVYLHLGEQYLVRELDLEARTARRRAVHGDWYTQAKKETATAIVEEPLRVERRLGLELTFGRVVGDRAGRRATRRRRSATAGDARASSRSTCRRRRSTPRRSGSCREPQQLEGLETMPRCSRRSTPPSTR